MRSRREICEDFSAIEYPIRRKIWKFVWQTREDLSFFFSPLNSLFIVGVTVILRPLWLTCSRRFLENCKKQTVRCACSNQVSFYKIPRILHPRVHWGIINKVSTVNFLYKIPGSDFFKNVRPYVLKPKVEIS